MNGAVAPGTERLRVNQLVSDESTQAVVRGIVTVPDPKPDVEKILSTDKTVKVRNVETVPDKVIVEGTLTLQIVYVAFEPDQSVHHMHGQVDFTTFVEVPGALPGMTVDVDITVEDVNITRRKGHPRDFDVAAVLEVSARVSDVMDIDVVTECPESCVCETEEITVDHLIGSNRRQVMISDDFRVPDEKPSVEKILFSDVKVEITNTKVLRNKVIVDGAATVTVMYVGLLPEQPVHSLHRTFNFSDFVEVPGAMQDMDVRFDVMVESVDVDTVRHKPDRLRVDIVLRLTANVVEPRTVNVITDISDCDVETNFTELNIDSLVGENTNQVIVKDTFETPDPKPDVEKILETTVDKVTVTEEKIVRDKVIVSGEVDVQIVYVAALENQAVHAMHRTIPFRTFVEVMGAREDDDVEVKVDVEFTTASAKGCEVTVEVVLKVTARVTRPLTRDVLTTVSEPTPEPTECPPGETITYVVQRGDTLYQIGRTYGVTVNQILAANPNIDPGNLQVGTQLTIPCVAKG